LANPGWLSKWFGRRPAAGPRPDAVGPRAAAPGLAEGSKAPAVPTPDPRPTAASRPPLLCWLLDAAVPVSGLGPAEKQALDTIDRVLKLPSLPPELAPRSASLVPQLLALLRQDDLPVPALAERIGKEAVLAAEVLRQAGGAHFAHLGPVHNLPQAIQRLGFEGLQMAIARVLMRPLYQSRPGTLMSVAAPRLWDHADTLARHAADQARQAGQPAFDGYLAGLLHDTGWMVLFHAVQRSDLPSRGPFSLDGCAALEERAHALFGRAATAWPITPAFTALADDATRVPLAASQNPLAQLLLRAQPGCMDELLSQDGPPSSP
jgi:hypothetical protein